MATPQTQTLSAFSQRVIPEAGLPESQRISFAKRAIRDPETACGGSAWIPACAGMTVNGIAIPRDPTPGRIVGVDARNTYGHDELGRVGGLTAVRGGVDNTHGLH